MRKFNRKNDKPILNMRSLGSLWVLPRFIVMMVLATAAAVFPVSAKETEKQKAAEKQIGYSRNITYEITPDTIIPDSLPLDCTIALLIVDNVLEQCAVPDRIAEAEEKIGGFIPISQYPPSMFKVGKGIAIYPEELWQKDGYGDFAVLRMVNSQPKSKLEKSSSSLFFFERYPRKKIILSREQLNIIGRIFDDRSINSIFIYPIVDMKISLAKMYPNYSFTVYRKNKKETRNLYNAYFEEIENSTNTAGSVYGMYLYTEGKTGFYLFYDTEDRLKDFINRAIYLFLPNGIRGDYD